MRWILAVLAFLSAGAALADVPVSEIEDFLADAMPGGSAPGLAYAVIDNGELLSGARGETRLGSGEAVTPDTPFALGSISKSFTAVAIMQLVEAGQLGLDDAVSQHLESLAGQPAGAITIRQLLSHTSGYSTVQGNAMQAGELPPAPASPPGSAWEYSNANYAILGAVIEAVSGRPYAEAIEAGILQPLGMTSSFVADGRAPEGVALGHAPWFGSRRLVAPEAINSVSAPAGGIFASASDTARYLAMMMNGEDDIISAASKQAMMRPASDLSPHYGFGWNVDGVTLYHTGTTPGTETLAIMEPGQGEGAGGARGRAVIVLVNAGAGFGFGELANLINGIAARAMGWETPAPDAGWSRKALFLTLAILPPVFILLTILTWRSRAALRAKSGTKAGVAGKVSLWLPLAAMLAMGWVLLQLIPMLFGTTLSSLYRYVPDLVTLLVATSATGLLWALARLAIGYGGRTLVARSASR